MGMRHHINYRVQLNCQRANREAELLLHVQLQRSAELCVNAQRSEPIDNQQSLSTLKNHP